MRSATSSFKTLLKSDWKRGWPLCFLYTFILFFSLTIPVWNEGRRYHYPVGDAADTPLLRMNNQVFQFIPFSVVIVMIGVAGLSMFLFAYLMKANSAGMMHALPVSRGRQFAAHFAAGMSMITAGHAVIFLLTVLMEAAGAGVVGFGPLLHWLGIAELSGFFFLTLAMCCAMVTGWLLAVPVIYVGVNFMVLAYRLLFTGIAGTFYRGYNGSDGGALDTFTYWCTPVVKLAMDTTPTWLKTLSPEEMARNAMNGHAWSTMAVYTVAGVVLLALAYVLYKARHSETAGMAIVFGWLRPIVRYVIAVAGGLALGLLVYELLSDGGRSLTLLVICQIVMGALVYVAVEMLLRKTYRIFDRRSAVGVAALALILVLIPVSVKMDLFGYQRRVPRPEDVQAVEIYGSYFNNATCRDPETVTETIVLHQMLIDRSFSNAEDGPETAYFTVRYALVNGDTFSRSYTFYTTDDEVCAQLEKVINRPDVRLATLMSDYGAYGETFTGGVASNWMTGRETVLNAEQCAALYHAAELDAQVAIPLKEWQQRFYTGTNMAQMELNLTTTQGTYSVYNISPECTHILALLQEYGVYQNDRELFPREVG